MSRVLLLAALVGCGNVTAKPDAPTGGGGDGATHDSASGSDAPGTPVTCSHTAPFTSTAEVMGVNTTSMDESAARLSHDELTIVFTRMAPGGAGGDIYVATRSSKDAAFGVPIKLPGSVDTTAAEFSGWLSADGLTAYYDRFFSSGYNIYRSTRTAVADNFGAEVEVANVSNGDTTSDFEPFVVPGVGMYFSSTRTGNTDMFLAAETGSGFAAAAALPSTVNSANYNEEMPTPSNDGLALYFFRWPTSNDVWVSTRASTSAAWGTPTDQLGMINTAQFIETPGWLSDDNCRLYYNSNASGTADLRVAIRQP